MPNQRSWLAVLLVSVLALSACGGSGADTVSEGNLTVCTDSPYPPMEFERDGEFVGFDIDIMRAVAGELDLELVVVNTGFDPITSGLAMESDECDIAAASITITPEREEQIDFTNPYFVANQSLLVKNDSGLNNLADFAGHRLGVQSGTTGEIYAQTNMPQDSDLVSFENPGDLFTALEAGDISGVLQDIVPNAEQALNDTTVSVVETYPTDEKYGFAVQEEGSEDLLEDVNEALQKVIDDGRYQNFCQTWFGNDCTLP